MMTSKEAQEIILKNIDDLDLIFDEELQKAISKIADDLKLLEDLMNHICFEGEEEDECHQYVVFDRFIENDDIDTEELFYKMKGWLEND